MQLAFLAYSCPPCSGRRRHLRFLLEELQRRGHSCRVYSTLSTDDVVPGVDWHQVAPGFRRRQQQFLEKVQSDLAGDPADGVISLDPYPDLDIYLAVDPLVTGRDGSLWERFFVLPEIRHRAEALMREGNTHVLFPSESRRDSYQRSYKLPDELVHVLGPGLGPDRQLPADPDGRRRTLRTELDIGQGEYTLLFVGNDFRREGLDRAVTTLAKVQEEQPSIKSRLLVVGADKPGRKRRIARQLKVADDVLFLGARDDIADLMLAADLLVCPARGEVTGSVLLEALAVGLPSVMTDDCAHAHHVTAARAGILLSSPFSQEVLDRAVMRYLDGIFRADCRESARLYARLTDLGPMYREAADLVEQLLG